MKTEIRYSAVVVGLLATLCSGPAGARPTMSLDGVWHFRFAPDDSGLEQAWYRPGVVFDKRLRVPGCWDAQGVGKPTDKLRHNGIGVGWYRRSFTLPKGWAGRRIWLRIGGAHRSATVWINGRRVGEHWGYPVAFTFDITPFLAPDRDQTVVIAVDGRRHPDRDPLTGAFDIIDYMNIDWGGIFEPITIEATDEVWVEDAFILPDPAREQAHAKVSLRRADGASLDGLAIRFAVRPWAADGAETPVLDAGSRDLHGKMKLEWDLNLREAPSWTPDTPRLLTLDIILRRGQATIDERSVRFGQRRIEIRGNDFYLNGDRFFLRGYGDDFTFPRRLVPPPDAAFWRAYLRWRKAFGLNAVRHHSTMMPESYLAAADEVGVFVQPALPIAYAPFFKAATPRGHDLYRQVWRSYIRQMRNHPSVFAWCMGNEQWGGFKLGPELYEIAKRLDPTRPVIDTDGSPWNQPRKTLDYIVYMFDVHHIPWGPRIGKFRLPAPPKRPIVSHETTNISVLPDPADIPKYDGIVKPFWLQRMADQVRKRGLAGTLDRMLDASERLQASLIKLNIEAARLSPEVDGFYQWLFRDYWTQSTGIVNQFDEFRALTPEKGRQFFGEVAVLWDHDRVNYRLGENIPLRMFISDFRPRAAGPRLETIIVRLGEQTVTLDPPRTAGGRGLIGPWTGQVQAPALTTPKMLILKAAAGPVHNEWAVWVFPRQPREQPAVRGSEGVLSIKWLSRSTVEKLAAGASVWMMDEDDVFPVSRGRFKPAWWKGDDTNDACYGNMILPHPALRGFPNEGYGDLQMAGMLDERPVVMMDALPTRIEPIIWGLDVPWRMRRKAYLFEAKVGKGRLLVSTLDLSQRRRQIDPAADWMFHRLLEYVQGSEFRPRAALPVDWFQKRVAEVGRPDPDTWVEGFAKVIESTEEAGTWYTYREDQAPSYAVRQTDGRQRLQWATAVVPKNWPHKTVTFVWAGGIGWRSEPGGGHFSLALNGRTLLDFPFVQKTRTFKSKDGKVRFQYGVRRTVGVDSFGLFFLTVPASRVRLGEPNELSVTATAQNSRRWFGLNPYRDVAARECQAY